MSTGISSPLALSGLYSSVDGRYLAANGKPFTSVSNAESALNGFPSKLSESCIGLTVLVKESSWPKAKEYWVQPKGTTPETYGLVEKGAGVTDYNNLDNKPTIGDGVNTALPIVGNVKVSATTASGETAGVNVIPGLNAGEIEMQFTLPKGADGADGQDGQDGAPGADAVNPFKGYYQSGVSKPAAGAVGDYLYAPPSDSQSTATATIWHYDSTQTPPWTDTGIDVSAVVALEFGSGQSVPATKIKDENGEEVVGPAGVLSAEARKEFFVDEKEFKGDIDDLLDNVDGLYIRFVIVNEDYPNGVTVPNYRDLGTGTDLDENARTALRSNYNNNIPSYKSLSKNYYSQSADYGSAKIAISSSDTITIKANENYPCFYTILKNELTSNSTNPVEGATGYGVGNSNIVRQIDAGETETITVPSDGAYLYLYLGKYADGEGNRIFKPEKVSIKHSVIIKEWIKEANRKIFDNSYVYDFNIATNYLSGLRIAANNGNKIISTQGSFAIKYAHLNTGDIIQVERLPDLPARSTVSYKFGVGYTSEVPAEGVSVYTDDSLEVSGSVEITTTPNMVLLKKEIVRECYIVVSGSTTSNALPNIRIKKGEQTSEKIRHLSEVVYEGDERIEEYFKQSKYIRKDSTSNGITFLHFSDIHGDNDSLYSIVNFFNRWRDNIDDAVCSGDMVANTFADPFIFNGTPEGSENILLCIGNHDSNYSSDWFNKVGTQEYYERYMGNAPYWGDITQPKYAATNYLCYYYKDYSNSVRLIVLDMMEWIKDGQQTTPAHNQRSWLIATLQDAANNNLHVVIMEHFPFTTRDTSDELIEPPLERQANIIESNFSLKGQHPAISHATYPSGYSQFTHAPLNELKGIVEDFKNKTGDFSECTAKGVFVCYLAGHTHYDCFENIIGTTQKAIVIGTASPNKDSKTIRNLRDNTIDLFNLVTINPTDKVVKVFRVGGYLAPDLQKIDAMSFEY